MDLFWTKSARKDILAIEKYFVDLKVPKEIIHAIILEIYQSGITLKAFPMLGKVLDEEETRKLVLTHYYFVILYTVKNQKINILRILDTRMNNEKF
jgi:plasmid stabilization system protein ParE